MKRPTENDFEINVASGSVEAIFKPTNSHYSFNRLVDEKDIARFGPISTARVRHAVLNCRRLISARADWCCRYWRDAPRYIVGVVVFVRSVLSEL